MSVIVDEVIRKLPDPQAIFPSLDTPYSKYSNTNYTAWGDDIVAIRKIVHQHKQQISDIDVIMKSIKNVFTELQKKRDQILSSAKAHLGFISCIRRLPSEILREIFLYSLGPPTYNNRWVPALLLTRICRRWREIVLDTPRLWCSLSIMPRGRVPEQKLFLYSEWLSYARERPLSLSLNLSYSLEWRNAVIEVSRPYISRCHELTIGFDDGTGVAPLLKDVPMLKFLGLRGDMEKLRNARMISIIQPQPHLRTLTISSAPFEIDILSVFNPGWTNLTYLSVVLEVGTFSNFFDDTIFITLLQMCPNLIQMIFSPCFFSSDTPVSVIHPNLRSLVVNQVFQGYDGVDMLMFPNLRHLQVGPIDPRIKLVSAPPASGGSASPGAGHEISNIVATPRSRFCNITFTLHGETISHRLLSVFNLGWTSMTHLRIDFVDNERVFWEILQLCPNLEELGMTLRNSKIAPTPQTSFTHPKLRALFISLKVGSSSRILRGVTLPTLRCLCMRFYGNPTWRQAHFKAFLSRSSCPLESLCIYGARPFKEENRAELSALIPTLKQLEVQESVYPATR